MLVVREQDSMEGQENMEGCLGGNLDQKKQENVGRHDVKIGHDVKIVGHEVGTPQIL